MAEIDRVFARFQDNRPEPADRRETLNIPRRDASRGTRVVEVVHLRSGAGGKDRDKDADKPRRASFSVRAATWDEGFPARKVAQGPIMAEPAAAEVAPPTAHLMPMWEPTPAETDATPPAGGEAPAARRAASAPRRPRTDGTVRRVADPFDSGDDGANCLRCGYEVEPAREGRGLLTCAACG